MNNDVNHMTIPPRGYGIYSTLRIFIQEEKYIIKCEIKLQCSLKLAIRKVVLSAL